MITLNKQTIISKVVSVVMLAGMLLGSVPAPALAAIYAPGATLNPSCLPTDANCGVDTAAFANTGLNLASATSTPATTTSQLYNVSGTLFWNGNAVAGLSGPSAITSLNGLATSTQSFAVGTSGSDFGITSSGSVHTFNLPSATSTTRGLLTAADWTAFNNKISSQWTTSGSNIYYNTGNVGIGTANPGQKLEVAGSVLANGFNATSTSSPFQINGTTVLNIGNGTTFVGDSAGANNQALAFNATFVGYHAGQNNTTGILNTAVGGASLNSNTTGSSNTANGATALAANTTGGNNSAFGALTLQANITGNDNTGVGAYVLSLNTGNSNTAVGSGALLQNTTGGSNTALGNVAGTALTTGSDNTLLGANAGGNLTTGDRNIIIGSGISAPSATSSNQLSIGNLIFGAGLNATGTAIATGNIGIGTTNPSSKLQVAGTIESTGLLFSEGANTVLGFNYPDTTYDRRLRITAGKTDTANNSQGASVDLHGNAAGGALDLVAGGATGALTFWTNNTQRAVIDASGNVGIGTAAPGATLAVNSISVTNNPLSVGGQINISAFPNYLYRAPITVTASGALTDYQTSIVVNTAALVTAGKMQADGRDIRITASDSATLQNYWIETGTMNTATTRIWFKAASLAFGANTFYLYYGNPSATAASNGDNVFTFFDDFNGTAVDTAKWTVDDATGISVSGGSLNATNNNAKLRSQWSYAGTPVIQETQAIFNTEFSVPHYVTYGGFWASGSDGISFIHYRLNTFMPESEDGYYMPENILPYGNTDSVPLGTEFLSRASVISGTQVAAQMINYSTGVLVNDQTHNNTVSNGERILLVRSGNDVLTNATGAMSIRFVRVRAYAASEPTMSVGSEEATPTTTAPATFLTVNSSGNVLPGSDSAYDLGSATNRWRDLYLSGNTLHIGDQALSNSGGSLVWSGASIEATPNATNSTEIKLSEISTNGTNYTGFKAPDSLAANVLYALPSADGASGQTLSTNGSSALSWATPLTMADIPDASATARGLLTSADWTIFNNKLGTTLTSGNIFVGNGSNTATAVAPSGDATISNAGVLTIAADAVTSGKILDGAIVDADVNATAAIALSKIAGGSSIVTSLGIPAGSSANGGSIASNVLTLSLADGTNSGVVSTGVQTLAGAKTFSSAPTLSSMTAGSLLFAGTGGLVSQNNTGLFWDNTNGRLGIGTANPGQKLEVAGSVLANGFNATSTSSPFQINGTTVLNIGNGTTFVGDSAGANNQALAFNATFVGYHAGQNNTTGILNTAVGGASLNSNTTGLTNTAVGATALASNTTGSNNSAFGAQTLMANISGSGNTAVGSSALFLSTGSSNTAVGSGALLLATTGNNNTADGGNAGLSITTGSDNTLLGANAGGNLTTGDRNIIIGSGISAPSATSSNQLSIGNLIFGTGLDATGTAISTGNVGIGTTTPTAKLEITPTDTNALRINPFGASAGNTGGLQFMELSANGTNYTGFKAPDSLAANVLYALPSADGASGQTLSTNGSSALSWATPLTMADIPDASATARGVVSTSTQTLAGAKTFSSAPTLSSMTAGSLLFAGAGGLVSQNNSNLFWDNTNSRLGIGTISPSAKLDVVGSARFQQSSGADGAADALASGRGLNIVAGGLAFDQDVYGLAGVASIGGAASGGSANTSDIIGVYGKASVAGGAGANTRIIGVYGEGSGTGSYAGYFQGNIYVNGGTTLASTTPAITASTLYNQGGSLYWNGSAVGGGSSQWTTSGSNIYYNTGNVGIGTTTPDTKLAIAGGDVSVMSAPPSFSATGGTITISGGYTIHTFTSSGTFTVTGSGTVDVLAVAGGGGGGGGTTNAGGAGAGAGGVVYNTSQAVSSGSITVTVGNGGAGGAANANGANGGNSAFGTTIATGGGGGGANVNSGSNGGSGGGGGFSKTGGTGTAGQGNNGGNGGSSTFGAGGGAGGVGGNAGSNGGNGGPGASNSITGAATIYAGGGAGGVYDFPPSCTNIYNGTGGSGGGGNVCVAGTNGLGGGAGGAGVANSVGPNGGSGIVIVRYLTPTKIGGNVGIGTTTPSQLLEVVRLTDGVVARFTDANGSCDINPTNTALVCSSDARLKKNVVTIDQTLEKMLALNPVTFNWNKENNGTEKHLGFIAQDVEKLFPSLVSTNEDGLKAIAYGNFTPLIIKSIQEQQLEIAGLTGSNALAFVNAETIGTDENVITNPVVYITDKIVGGVKIAKELVTERMVAVSGYFKRIFANELCLTDASGALVCVTGDNLKNISGSTPLTTSSSTPVTSTSAPAVSEPDVISTPVEQEGSIPVVDSSTDDSLRDAAGQANEPAATSTTDTTSSTPVVESAPVDQDSAVPVDLSAEASLQASPDVNQ